MMMESCCRFLRKGREINDQPSKTDVIFPAILIFLPIVNWTLDAYNAYTFYIEGEYTYAILTSVAHFVSFIVVLSFSYGMFRQDHTELSDEDEKISIKEILPIIRSYRAFEYAKKSRKAKELGKLEAQQSNLKQMRKENEDICLLKIFEAYMEAAPQCVLQIVHLLKLKNSHSSPRDIWWRYVAAFITLGIMAFCLLTYQRTIRLRHRLHAICYGGCLFLFVWHILVSASRVFFLGAMLYFLKLPTLIAVLLHWVAWSIFIHITVDHGFCTTVTEHSSSGFEKLTNLLTSFAIAFVYIFDVFSPDDGSNFWRNLWFYSICVIEIILGVISLQYFACLESMPWLVYISNVLFILGILSCITYYQLFHPSKLQQLDCSS